MSVGFIEKVSFLYHKFCRLCIHDFMQSSWQRNSENRRKLKVTAVKHPARNHTANVGAAAAKSRQSCLTLWDPIDGSPPGSPIPGILQARTLEWGAISFSNAWKWKVKVKSLSRVPLFATPWALAYQAPPSMGFSRQEYWSGLLFPSPGDLPDPGIEPVSFMSPALASGFFITRVTWEAQVLLN